MYATRQHIMIINHHPNNNGFLMDGIESIQQRKNDNSC